MPRDSFASSLNLPLWALSIRWKLVPQYDPAGISTVLVAKTLREMLLLF